MPQMTNLQSADIIAMIVGGLDTPANSWVPNLSMRVDSDKDSEKYVWLGTAPVMRELVGGKQPKTIRENNFTVANKDFEATLAIKTEWLRRDKTGLIRTKVAQLQERAQDHDAKLLSALIDTADATPCYDGQFFFDTDHSEGDSGTQSNKINVDITTTTAPTAADMETAILTLVQSLYGLKDDQAEPINGSAKSFLVMVPVSFMKATFSALGADVIVEGGQARTNLTKAVGSLGGLTFDVLVNPRLTWTTKFALFRQDAVMKPFVDQVELDTYVTALAEGSDHEYKNKEHLYSVERTKNFGLNQWQGAMMAAFI